MFALFVTEFYPPETVAIGGAGLLLATGVLSLDDLLVAIASPAPLAIAAMFIISGALVRTGALGAVTERITRRAETHPVRTLLALGVFIIFASAFMNNTPVVLIFIPIVAQLAARIGLAPSKLMIPLSYCAILGGVCTLIGTSTNLLVDGVAQAQGLAPFSLFEVTPVAIVLALAGLGFMAVAAPRLLPERTAMAGFLSKKRSPKFITQVAVTENSPLIGEKPLTFDLFQREGMRVIDVLRGDASLRRDFPSVTFEAGDVVVIRCGMDELLTLRENRRIVMVDEIASAESVTVEALIGPDCTMVGRTLGRLRLRRRYGVYPLAVHRRSERVRQKLDDVDVRIGDTLLLEGAPEDIRRLAEDVNLVDLNEPSGRSYRRVLAPVVLATLAGVVGASAFGVIPIAAAATIGVAVVLLTRCIDADEAFAVIDGRLLVLIFAMLAVGRALQTSGAAVMAAEAIAPFLSTMPPWLALWCVFLFAAALTEIVTNAAVAVVVTPVAISLAVQIGVEPRPFVVAVMLAASLSFATPIGYQTNTMVYGPGGYRFTDFMRLGVPMNLGLGLLTSFLIPLFWPL
ncbi:SLC13 family permease [Pikeienuella piscinae]|uniref:SLC13 family permease n=2 Tax=Pikeienuella piscinae TaxID=2748098 RepID=A0A7M3T6W1_9RHOB|nr:SLC13 family permease [Pikeienuella piscinae]QIE57742.1 SLC13 family permease [Pikeienuella piscinae]